MLVRDDCYTAKEEQSLGLVPCSFSYDIHLALAKVTNLLGWLSPYRRQSLETNRYTIGMMCFEWSDEQSSWRRGNRDLWVGSKLLLQSPSVSSNKHERM